MADSSEEIPLNPTDFKEKVALQRTHNGDLARQRSCSASTLDPSYNAKQYLLFGASNETGIDQSVDDVRYQNRAIQRELNADRPKQNLRIERDIAAMSIASMYDDENKEMDSDNEYLQNMNNNNGGRSECETSNKQNSNVHSNNNLNGTPHDPNCPNCYNVPKDPLNPTNPTSASLYFNDGMRHVDFVLVWKPKLEDQTEEDIKHKKRSVFEENLLSEGLEIERDIFEDLNFIKLHAPLEVLRRYSEILKLRMPMREPLCRVHNNHTLSSLSNAAIYITHKIPGFKNVQSTTATALSSLKGCWSKFGKCLLDETHFPPKAQRFTAVYSRDKEYLFDVQQKCFFSPAIRSRIVQFILDRKRFTLGTEDDYAFGIDRLITDEVYLAAYPLHDGEITIPGSMRHLLYSRWATVRKWYRYQPLDYIKEYFGVKIGLYFAWLGYYTYMLLLASVVGIACFMYSWLTIDTYKPSRDICSGNIQAKMCPLCDSLCDYWDLKETCMHVRITYLFDNSTTVFFAIFMSFWATLFLELWKRYSAEITHRWDLTGFDIHEEHPRPQYLARLSHIKRVRIDPITNTKEPNPPFWRMKLPAALFSFSVVLLLVTMAVAAVLGVVLYRMSVLAALSAVHEYDVTTSNAIWFTTITAACINLCLIQIFNWIYTWLAEWLTEFEILRTQTEFDDSLTLKIYLLQFVNYYASIFYIAFFKGKFIGYPGHYNRFFNFRQEECGLGGCLTELCIQLAIIMVGKQAMNTILEMILPIFYKWLNLMHISLWKRQGSKTIRKDCQRWLRDLKLVEWGPRSLFSEYLEMVLQYGFVTIFVAAFPLAPFFALLNNILEMRLDAKKLLTFHRRPVTQRVRDIGVWYRILDCIAKLSVITNGFIIAFTSDFIPRLVYRMTVSSDGSLRGYLNHTLAYFDTASFPEGRQPRFPTENVTMCRYPDYREPPWSNNPYERTNFYWYVLAARLAFVVLFENFVAIVMILVRWGIPDMSGDLRDQIRREAYITNEIIIKQEAIRARLDNGTDENDAEPPVNLTKIQQLMSGALSGSQLDLVMHGPGNPTAPGHGAPDQMENVNCAFLISEKNNSAQRSNRHSTA